jgi:hypothetical protein
MSQHMLSDHYVDVLLVLGIVLVFLWLRLSYVNVRKFFAHAALTVTGYLRRRPDPAVECALRAAFAEFDRELSVILADRPPRDAVDR